MDISTQKQLLIVFKDQKKTYGKQIYHLETLDETLCLFNFSRHLGNHIQTVASNITFSPHACETLVSAET